MADVLLAVGTRKGLVLDRKEAGRRGPDAWQSAALHRAGRPLLGIGRVAAGHRCRITVHRTRAGGGRNRGRTAQVGALRDCAAGRPVHGRRRSGRAATGNRSGEVFTGADEDESRQPSVQHLPDVLCVRAR